MLGCGYYGYSDDDDVVVDTNDDDDEVVDSLIDTQSLDGKAIL